MIKQLLYSIVSLLLFFSAIGQTQIGLWERYHLQKMADNEMVSVLYKGDKAAVEKLLHKYEATLKYHYKNVGAISISKKHLDSFMLEIEGIELEIPVSSGHLMMDTALIVNNIADIHQGASPLPQAYTGKGVIVGFLDSGIYFDHEDFKNPDGTSRIRFIWDQRVNSTINPPAPYGYGQEWSWIDINNGSCTHVEPANQFGHGTTVAGAATGNGRANGFFKGVAPEAEIIVVGVRTQNNFLPAVADAVDYIFKKADALGKPCVINTSLGTYFGSHDGKDLTSQIIEALLEERPGRVVVASAGNGNNIGNQDPNYRPFHLGYDVTLDTSFTWFRRISGETVAYFDLWADTSDFNNVWFSIGNNNNTDYELIGNIPFVNILSDFSGDLEAGVQRNFSVFSQSGVNQGLVEIFARRFDSRYRIEFLITPIDQTHWWRFMTTGSGRFDVWSSQSFTTTSNMEFTGLPPEFILPEMVNYKAPDTRKTIVSSWQCSDKVVTVGNYYNQGGYYDVDSVFHLTGNTVGDIAFRSSEGPTRDNRLKPDISATGDIIFATGNLNFIASALNSNRPKVAYGGLHNSNGGTSMSSPIVAGVAALYLEKNPDAWWFEIKESIVQTAKRDTFTGPDANVRFGNGKLDGLEVLLFDAILGCTDSTAFNYNPFANVEDGSCEPVVEGCTDENSVNFNPLANTDDGSCIPVILGCTDSTALNYNPLANTDDNSCEFSTDTTSLNFTQNQTQFTLYPNPMSDYCVIQFNHSSLQKSIGVYDILGKKVAELNVPEGQTKVKMYKGNLQKGIYLIRIESFGKSISSTEKLIVQ